MSGDLRYSYIGWSRETFERGEIPTAEFAVVNISDFDVTESFTSALYLSDDNIVSTDDYLITEVVLDGLSAGEISETFTAENPVPIDISDGDYWLILSIDSFDDVDESSESNNFFYQNDGTGFWEPITISGQSVEPSLSFQHPFDDSGSMVYSEERDGDGWRETNGYNEPTKSGLQGHPGHDHYHLGEDWVPESGKVKGREISAVADGEVVYSNYHEFFGNTIIIKHDVSENDGLDVNEVFSLYAHLEDSFDFSILQEVVAGEVIGTLGNTGKGSKGAHLHLEIMSADWEGYLEGDLGLYGYAETQQQQWFDPTDFIQDYFF